jgi:hypothetical protein
MTAIRLPGFTWAAATSALVLAVLTFLIVIDSYFAGTIALASIDWGLSSQLEFDQESLDEALTLLSGRWWLLVTLCVLAIASTAVMLGRLFANMASRRTLATTVMATIVIAGWLGLFTHFERLHDYSIYQEVQRLLPELEVLAHRLRADWPLRSVEIPSYGYLSPWPDHPTLLAVAESEARTPLSAVTAIHKHGNAILFGFSYSSGAPFSIEFHQGVTTPQSFVEEAEGSVRRYELHSFAVIDEGVYLSQYHESIEFPSGDVIEVLWE